MTDNEIIKALNCCGSENCRGCPYRNGKCHQGNPMIRDALSLINRQKAEIDSWQSEHKRACAERDAHICTNNFVRNEAIKWFAYRLKTRYAFPIYPRDIDELVKEMTEVHHDHT